MDKVYKVSFVNKCKQLPSSTHFYEIENSSGCAVIGKESTPRMQTRMLYVRLHQNTLPLVIFL